MIRVILIDESPRALSELVEGLRAFTEIEVVGKATDADNAFKLIEKLKPSVICAALEFTNLNKLTQLVMQARPTPILLLSNSVLEPAISLKQMTSVTGAIDVLGKPPHLAGSSMQQLASRLKVLAGVKVFGLKAQTPKPRAAVSNGLQPKVVAIGASTGGPQALARLFSSLKADFPWPILCVQHMSMGFLNNLIDWLDGQTKLSVKIAKAGDHLEPGRIYFAPEDLHLLIGSNHTLVLDHGEAVDGHRPSVTALFNSVAKNFGAQSIGILLTGMGCDGASGLLSMLKAGAPTLAQDEKSSVVYGMAGRAVEMNAAEKVLDLNEISQYLIRLAERRKP